MIEETNKYYFINVKIDASRNLFFVFDDVEWQKTVELLSLISIKKLVTINHQINVNRELTNL